MPPGLHCMAVMGGQAARCAWQDNEQLLKLYESGLPAWAVHMPHYGIFYRPWMRTVTWLLFVAISSFSLAMGFYDLWHNVPYLDRVRAAVFMQASLECIQHLLTAIHTRATCNSN